MADSSRQEADTACGDSSDDEIYNPTHIQGDNVWEPDPHTIAELYEKIDKNGVLELNWKNPGKVASQGTASQHTQELVQETPEEVIRLREKQQLVSMFEDEDFNNQMNTPTALSKTPKAPKSTNKAKASFDKIFNKVSLQAPPPGSTPNS